MHHYWKIDLYHLKSVGAAEGLPFGMLLRKSEVHLLLKELFDVWSIYWSESEQFG